MIKFEKIRRQKVNSRYIQYSGPGFGGKTMKKTLGRLWHRWKDNIKKGIRNYGREQDCYCTCDKWRALVNAVLNLRDSLPSNQLPAGGLQIKKKKLKSHLSIVDARMLT